MFFLDNICLDNIKVVVLVFLLIKESKINCEDIKINFKKLCILEEKNYGLVFDFLVFEFFMCFFIDFYDD